MCQSLSFLFLLRTPRVLAKAKVLQVKVTGYPTGKAEEIPVTCRASVQLCNSTPHPDPVKAEMLIPQTPYFTWHLPVLTYLLFAICCSAQMPCADREGRHTLPSPAHGHKVFTTDSQTQREEKNPTAFTWPRGALACLKVLHPAASSSQPRQAELEDRQTLKHKMLPGSVGNFWVPIASGKTLPSRGAKAKQGLIRMARDELFIKLFSHFQLLESFLQLP